MASDSTQKTLLTNSQGPSLTVILDAGSRRIMTFALPIIKACRSFTRQKREKQMASSELGMCRGHVGLRGNPFPRSTIIQLFRKAGEPERRITRQRVRGSREEVVFLLRPEHFSIYMTNILCFMCPVDFDSCARASARSLRRGTADVPASSQRTERMASSSRAPAAPQHT